MAELQGWEAEEASAPLRRTKYRLIGSNDPSKSVGFPMLMVEHRLTPSIYDQVRYVETVADFLEGIVRTGKLTVKGVQSVLAGKTPGRYFGDGGGLGLVVLKRDPPGERTPAGKPKTASYVYRFMLHGKSHEMGLGSAWDIDLAKVREKARQYRERIKADGVDVLAEKREKKRLDREAAKLATIKRPTFRQVAEMVIDAKDAGWRNLKSRASWEHTLKAFAYPIFGDLDPAAIDTSMVISVVEPIWLTKTETASRLRGRIEFVLDRAKVMGLREGDNPARWKGHLEHLLAKKSKVAPVEHHEALDYRQIGAFNAELRQQNGIAARALEFTVLTVARTGTVLKAEWSEFDEAERVWNAPADHMKLRKAHRYPLCDRALEIIAEMRAIRERRPSEFVFQGMRDGKPLSDMAMLMLLRRMGHDDLAKNLTTHGMRSTFADWRAERTNFSSELGKMALAHAVSDRVDAAYRRGDMFEKRRRLAEAWCRYCGTPAQNGRNVVAINAA
jgi:integrase